MKKLLLFIIIFFATTAQGEFRVTEIRNDVFGIRDYGERVHRSIDHNDVKHLNSAWIERIGDTACLFEGKRSKILDKRCHLRDSTGCAIRDYLMQCY